MSLRRGLRARAEAPHPLHTSDRSIKRALPALSGPVQALGIIPFGTMAEAWGAATGPRRSAGRRARLRKWRAAAPEAQQTATFAGVARQWLACAFRRFASLLGGDDFLKRIGATRLGPGDVAITTLLIRPRAVKRNGGGGPREGGGGGVQR